MCTCTWHLYVICMTRAQTTVGKMRNAVRMQTARRKETETALCTKVLPHHCDLRFTAVIERQLTFFKWMTKTISLALRTISSAISFLNSYSECSGTIGEMNLEKSLAEAKLAVHYFFDNKFEEAKQLLEPWAHSSMYHSIGNCVFLFLEAVLTFEQQHIQKASEAIKQCLAVCNQYRKKNTISESIGKTFKRVSEAIWSASNRNMYTIFNAFLFSFGHF